MNTPWASTQGLMVREYQLAAVQALDAAPPGERGAMFVMATGTGKTLTAHLAVVRAARVGKRVVWIAHREELIRQPFKTLCRWWPELAGSAGMVKAEKNQVTKQIVYASIQTLTRKERLAELLQHGQPDLLVVDEAHVAGTPAYQATLAALRGPHTQVLGLTATPDREDGARLSTFFEVVFSYSILDGLAEGALLPPYAALDKVPDLNLAGVGGRKDYTDHELERELMRVHIVDHTVRSIEKVHLAHRLPFKDGTAYFDLSKKEGGILVFTATVAQADATTEALKSRGWRAATVSAKTPKRLREALLEQFEAGELDVLCNAAVLTTGTDLPRCNVIVLARPTKSWSLYVQMVGRALRPSGSQRGALVLDLVGATENHSIVAAAVLVDGVDCPDSHDGQHRYLSLETGEGRCQDCGKIVRCFARKAGHLWKDGFCKACGIPQCPDSETSQHEWIPWDNGMRRCLHCEAQMRDPTGKIKSAKRQKEPIDWKVLLIPGVIRAAHLGGKMGVLFQSRVSTGQYIPFWHNGLKMHRLAPRPVDKDLCELLLEDVARRAQKVNGRYGARNSDAAYRSAYYEADLLAKKARLWEVTT